MARTLHGALQRAEKLAGTPPTASRHNHNFDHKNINEVKELEPKTHRISLNPQITPSVFHNHNHKVEKNPEFSGEKAGPARKGGVSLTKLVNSDPTFRQAMATWNIRGNALNYHCQRLGIHRTRKLLQHLLTWQQAFWASLENPGGYIARCLSNVEASTDAVTVAKTKAYEQYCFAHGLEG